MRIRSVRMRLTLWYFAVLALALLAFGSAMWFGMQKSLYSALDDSLNDRVRGVRKFIEEQAAWLSPEQTRMEFREHSVLGPGGDLFQVMDGDGQWIYRSDALYDSKVPIYTHAQLASGQRFEDLEIRGTPLRFLSSKVVALGRPYSVQVAAPLHEMREGLQRFFWLLLGGIPVCLGIASLGGYWISRRALLPVDQITAAARSINARDLSQRLSVPGTGDELQRLTETLNKMFERLQAAFDQVTRFTADASHELRTPVALMRSTAEIALRRQRPESEYREALAEILTELEGTSRLIDDLLFLARADSGAEVLPLSRTDLIAILRAASDQGRKLAEAKPLTFEVHYPDHPVIVDGDPPALRRLLLILIDNAVKYTAAGGHVTIRMVPGDGMVTVEVRDSGIGIPEEDLPRVFERFYRADKARSSQTGGAGLCLAIASWIVNVHGGSIEVQSRAGEGATVRVGFPLPED